MNCLCEGKCDDEVKSVKMVGGVVKMAVLRLRVHGKHAGRDAIRGGL